ncbi:MAG: hypothetical protein OEZ65_01550 [Gemmatimonadota bacterium]|nr:hypothetical protein [Gemmatimonadota bacterium]MDH5758242.1 hypothetical protein [Gemmatimonadota bacterium]
MTINGISNAYGTPTVLPGLRRPAGTEEAPQQGRSPSVQTPAEAIHQTAAPRRAAPSLSAQAPEGTDPALWSVLTSEERTFFARARSMGPLTYGPGRGGATPGGIVGGRVDLRV